jgi:cation diffusion facilitator family transporter
MSDGPDRRFRVGRRVALLGISTSATLAVLNLVIGVETQSSSVFAIGVEFAGDVLASTVVLLGMIIGIRPADAEHPYGHGRIESLAAFVVGLILVAGGLAICWNSLRTVGERHPAPSMAAVAALVSAVAVRGLVSSVKFRVGRKIGSTSLVADAWNDTVDIVGVLVALTAVLLAMFNRDRFLAADHFGGFAVGIIVVVTGTRVLRDASLELMDTMPDERMIQRVRATAAAVPGVIRVEKSYARKTGLTYHVDLHIQVDPNWTVADSHAVAGQVRQRVRREIAWVADVLVHVEPAKMETPMRETPVSTA